MSCLSGRLLGCKQYNGKTKWRVTDQITACDYWSTARSTFLSRFVIRLESGCVCHFLDSFPVFSKIKTLGLCVRRT